ncbi:MAG: hypothetical protein ACLQLC_07830 [Candidatus Sulfotelmatobacter sp.]
MRVRGTAAPGMCLWGSAGITQNTPIQSTVLLTIRNDKHGEIITFGTQVAGGTQGKQPTQSVIGTLQPGECFSIPIQGISGIFAYCVPATGSSTNPELESIVYCVITAH